MACGFHLSVIRQLSYKSFTWLTESLFAPSSPIIPCAFLLPACPLPSLCTMGVPLLQFEASADFLVLRPGRSVTSSSCLFWKRKQCHFIACMQNSNMPETISLKLPPIPPLGWDKTREVWAPKDDFSEKLGVGRSSAEWWNSSNNRRLPCLHLHAHSPVSPGMPCFLSTLLC